MNTPLHIQIEKWKQLPRVSQTTGDDTKRKTKDEFETTFGTDSIGKLDLEADKASKSFALLGSAIKNVTDGLGGTNLVAAKSFTIFKSVSDSIIKTAQATAVFEERNKDLIRGLGINNETAQEFGTTLDELAARYALDPADIKTYTQTFNEYFAGTSGFIIDSIDKTKEVDASVRAYADQLLVVNDTLQDQYGLTADQANQFQTYAMSAGTSATQLFKSFEAAANQIETATGQTGVLKEMMSAIAQVGTKNQLTFGQYPGQLALAAVQANRLGTSFDNIAAAGEKSLNIESSVASELEYQLLTGTKLEKNGQNLLNNLRQATVAGDATDLAKAYGDIFDVMGDISEMNLLEQDAAARALGISREELAVQFQRKKAREELLEQLGQDNKSLIELFDKGDIDELKKRTDDLEITLSEDVIKSMQDPNTALRTSQEALIKAIKSLEKAFIGKIDDSNLFGTGSNIAQIATDRAKLASLVQEEGGKFVAGTFEFAEKTLTKLVPDALASAGLDALGDAMLVKGITDNISALDDNTKKLVGLTAGVVSFFTSIKDLGLDFDEMSLPSILNLSTLNGKGP